MIALLGIVISKSGIWFNVIGIGHGGMSWRLYLVCIPLFPTSLPPTLWCYQLLWILRRIKEGYQIDKYLCLLMIVIIVNLPQGHLKGMVSMGALRMLLIGWGFLLNTYRNHQLENCNSFSENASGFWVSMAISSFIVIGLSFLFLESFIFIDTCLFNDPSLELGASSY